MFICHTHDREIIWGSGYTEKDSQIDARFWHMQNDLDIDLVDQLKVTPADKALFDHVESNGTVPFEIVDGVATLSLIN